MPSSLPSLDLTAEVRDYVASILPDAQLTDVAVDPDYQPLLLVQTKHTRAAFAFSNADVATSYQSLYDGFKKHYVAQKGSWDKLDLAFVFCVQVDFPHVEQFCSSVETDVYFCRKFVVLLSRPLAASLSRLPFLPLTPLYGHSLRPASAQTFLRQCNVPALLAKFLVVPHARSPQGIVEDCISGKFGAPPPPLGDIAPAITQTDLPTDPVRLETLAIRNFRAYRKTEVFQLGADVTVLYGPNGFGKTSFFDAIDFAVTGGIGRLESRGHSDFAKTAPHLDSRPEESSVTLTFRHKGVVRKITRRVGDRKQALLDDRSVERKAILVALTGGNIPAADRVENFVSLFRASHLFSYEQQELTKDFQDDCRLSEEIVSRMLAFEDYGKAATKTTGVRSVVQNAIADATEQIRILGERIATDTKELDRLGRTAKSHSNTDALDQVIDSLRTQLKAVGLTVTAAKPDITITRGWRADIESRHSNAQSKTERLSILAKEVGRVPQTEKDLSAAQQQLKEKEETLRTSEEDRVATELALQRAEQRLVEITGKRSAAQSRTDLIEWVRNTQPLHEKLVALQGQLGAELQRANEALAEARLIEDNARKKLLAQESLAQQAAEKLKTGRTDLTALNALQETIPRWQASRTRLSTIVQSEQALLKSLELTRAEGREITHKFAAATAEEARLAHQISEVDKNQTELRTLVSQLQGHVRTGTCPLCGEDHGSKDKLLLRIQEHVASDAASVARVQLTEVRERVTRLRELIAANTQKQQADEHQLGTLKEERIRLAEDIDQFATAASTLRVTLEGIDSKALEQLQVLSTRLRQELMDLERTAQAYRVDADAARTFLATATNAVAAKRTEAEERKAALSRTQEEISRLSTDSRLTQISINTETGELAKLANLNHAHLEELRAEAAKAEAEANQKKQQLGMIRQEISSQRSQIAALRTKLSNLQNTLSQITVRLEEAQLPKNTTEDSLLVLIAEQTRFQAQLLSLRDAVSGLELAMDAATTAAALTTLRQNVRNDEKALAQATTAREEHVPWLKYFDEIFKLVSSQQNSAIANFARDYGPRASVIQRRLRTVYGFDELEIRSRGSTISVRVKRRGAELRPTDYFSQSQQQTLLLGLFLTASSSQTWSAFSPVLLDDPVTHFDDLNTYAFLDLLVGLLESELDKRQFIISTCDEKLLQLARQKFRHLGDRAKFYRFTSIGADGPSVTEAR